MGNPAVFDVETVGQGGIAIERRQTGYDLDMSGFDSEHLSYEGEVLWRNPWPGNHWPDDTIATLLVPLRPT